MPEERSNDQIDSYLLTSPLGLLELEAGQDGLKGLQFLGHNSNKTSATAIEHPILQQAKSQLTEYFSGERTAFDLPFSIVGTTFQQSVWQALTDIPYGQTVSYGQLSGRLNNPGSVRAVGRANGQNPIPIIIPCHRVIGADGKLTGYSGGLNNKKWLLKHEGALLL